MQPPDVEPVVAAQQQRLFGEEAHLLAVGGDAAEHRCVALLLAGPILPAGNDDAGDQPPQVPLPTAGVRLVEVVEVDHQLTLGGSVETEVAQMGVPADHRCDAGGRELGHVCGHHDGGSSQEAVRRRDHPRHADRYQPVQPSLVRVDE